MIDHSIAGGNAIWPIRLSTAHFYTRLDHRFRDFLFYDGQSSFPGEAPLTTLVTSSPEANSTVELIESLYAGQEKVDPSSSCAWGALDLSAANDNHRSVRA